MRKSRRDFITEASSRRSPYELELEHPTPDGKNYVTFRDPNRLPTQHAFRLAKIEDPVEVIKVLLSDEDYAAFWDEWKDVPVDETGEMLQDVMNYYGADKGKS